jgi:hypothetical protein
LWFQIAVQDLLVVQVAEGETKLDVPIHHLLLGEKLAAFLSGFDLAVEVTGLAVCHYNAKEGLVLCEECLLESNDIWVLQIP